MGEFVGRVVELLGGIQYTLLGFFADTGCVVPGRGCSGRLLAGSSCLDSLVLQQYIAHCFAMKYLIRCGAPLHLGIIVASMRKLSQTSFFRRGVVREIVQVQGKRKKELLPCTLLFDLLDTPE